MQNIIGPYRMERIALCSADAGPGAQRKERSEAGRFFPGAKWVGTVRNAGKRLGRDMFILTTGHGLVRPTDKITPYDQHINRHPQKVASIWRKTVPRHFDRDRYDLVLFYAGGCPRDSYLKLLLPILAEVDLPLLTFGRPAMFDSGKLDEVVTALSAGTSLEKLKALLKKPEYLMCCPPHKPQPSDASRNPPPSTSKPCTIKPSRFTVPSNRVLFDPSGNAHLPEHIAKCIRHFRPGYRETVKHIIQRTETDLDQSAFVFNAAVVLSRFGMARGGPFEGVKAEGGTAIDPHGRIEACWKTIEPRAKSLRRTLRTLAATHGHPRLLTDMPGEQRDQTIDLLWGMFKDIIPCCMGRHTFGMVAAGKIIFSAFPEVTLPVDNAQWRFVFQTIDWGDVLRRMHDEIVSWEASTGKRLDRCDPAHPVTTLPVVYNVMSMEARPR